MPRSFGRGPVAGPSRRPSPRPLLFPFERIGLFRIGRQDRSRVGEGHWRAIPVQPVWPSGRGDDADCVTETRSLWVGKAPLDRTR